MSVLVVGSFITDCIATCKRAPNAGETLVGKSFNTYLGGKGANQAIAAKRMGSEVTMIGAVGSDDFGKRFIKTFSEEGFDTTPIKISTKTSTGVSQVTVEENGQNRICMVPGANLDYTVDDLLVVEDYIKDSDIIVSQFEMNYDIVVELSRLSKKYQKKFILNPAPAHKITSDVLDGLYLITPNETELGILIDKELKTLEDYENGAKELLKMGVKNVIVTLGTIGSLLVNDKNTILVPAFKVKAIDTVGAGDSYTGSLSAMLDQKRPLNEAMQIATAVAALEVQKSGAIPAMPYKDQVFEFLKEKGIEL